MKPTNQQTARKSLDTLQRMNCLCTHQNARSPPRYATITPFYKNIGIQYISKYPKKRFLEPLSNNWTCQDPRFDPEPCATNA